MGNSKLTFQSQNEGGDHVTNRSPLNFMCVLRVCSGHISWVDDVCVEERTERGPVSTLWTCLTLWREIDVDSFPFLFVSLSTPTSSLTSVSFPPLSLIVFSSFSSHDSSPAVRSWVLKSESGWRVPVVRAWRAGRHPSTNVSAVPLATAWWAVLRGWWVGARPKCRRAGASTIGRDSGRRWGWRAKLALLSQTVSGTDIQ